MRPVNTGNKDDKSADLWTETQENARRTYHLPTSQRHRRTYSLQLLQARGIEREDSSPWISVPVNAAYEEWFQEMQCSVEADDKDETSLTADAIQAVSVLIRAYLPHVGRGETAVMYGRLSLAIHKDNTLGPRDGKGLMSRLLVEAKILAQRQVAEAIISGDSDKGNCLHQDGTSKFFKKYLTFDVTLQSGKTLTMSMTEVPSGDADGILSAFSESCRELAEELCGPGEDIAKKTTEIITSFT
ncbi:hypothetical protein Bbelb_035590 [Branchiostoma belcheri]|nr:hypothetical protein Bbelb_035590 [Branchiostoma belcheri]